MLAQPGYLLTRLSPWSEASLQNPGSFEERGAVRRTKWQGAVSFGSFSLSALQQTIDRASKEKKQKNYYSIP
jgi:hypothetical protein